jgi:GAF domain-containing protein
MALQAIVDGLLAELGASRVTLRLDTPGEVFPVRYEALAAGTASIIGDPSVGDLREVKTFQWVQREKRLLVQDDTAAPDLDPPVPPALLEVYRARSQMLAPVLRDGEVFGVISIHYSPGPRSWTAEEQAVLERARARVEEELAPPGA